MRIYLALCCFNRPYDDQSQSRIRMETEAKLVLQQKVREGSCELLWSSVLLRNLRRIGDVLTVPPGDALAYLENWYED